MQKNKLDCEALENTRRSYELGVLDDHLVNSNPFELFKNWLDDALKGDLVEPNSMALATVSQNGKPSLRYVLLKGFDDKGLYFFTNYNSPKANDISANANVAASFFWDKLERQVRVEGYASKASVDISDNYFNSRPRISQLSVLSSDQSSIVKNRKELENKFYQIESEHDGAEIVRPSYWGGYLIVPESFEFWQGRVGRLHDRIKFEREGEIWRGARLSP